MIPSPLAGFGELFARGDEAGYEQQLTCSYGVVADWKAGCLCRAGYVACAFLVRRVEEEEEEEEEEEGQINIGGHLCFCLTVGSRIHSPSTVTSFFSRLVLYTL